MIIRPPTDEDEAAMHEVKRRAVEDLRKVYRPTVDGLARKAARAAVRTELVCEQDGTIVATVEYEDRGDTLHILGPMVHPEHRARGVARALLEHIAGIGRSMQKRALSLNTVKQTGNVPVFVRLGFQVVREEVETSGVVENLTDADLIDVYMERDIS